MTSKNKVKKRKQDIRVSRVDIWRQRIILVTCTTILITTTVFVHYENILKNQYTYSENFLDDFQEKLRASIDKHSTLVRDKIKDRNASFQESLDQDTSKSSSISSSGKVKPIDSSPSGSSDPQTLKKYITLSSVKTLSNANEFLNDESLPSVVESDYKKRGRIFFWKKPWANWKHDLSFCGHNAKCDLIFPDDNYKKINEFHRADAVVFHPVFDKSLAKNLDKLRMNRRPNQLFVFLQWESPSQRYHSEDRNQYSIYENFFNATMTYRGDSTYHFPYGSLVDTKLKYTEFSETSIPHKTHGVAALVSNCKIGYRNEIISRLYELLRVDKEFSVLDIYGACATEYNHTHANPDRLHEIDTIGKNDTVKLLSYLSRYKFFLAIENSKCKDYITEKLWINAIAAKVVPIVAGAGKGDYLKYLPEDSFLHVDDFSSLNELVNYIKPYLLSDDNEEYRKRFFSWKGYDHTELMLDKVDEYQIAGLCQLCQEASLLHNGDFIVSRPVIKDINRWWYFNQQGESMCRS